jgi:hypothetical protein
MNVSFIINNKVTGSTYTHVSLYFSIGKNEEELKSKILQLSRNLYPSIASFPVCK